MPRPPVTVTIAASERQHLVHGALIATVAGLTAWSSPLLVAAICTAALAATLIKVRRTTLVGQLRWTPGAVSPAMPTTTRLAGVLASFRHAPRSAVADALAASPGIDHAADRWQWRGAGDRDWRDIDLQCDVVGARLIALRWGGRTHWLWPDAVSFDDHHRLRRKLRGVARGQD